MTSEYILLADDSAEMRDFLKGFLCGEGYVVETAFDGAQAIEMINLGQFALVITDLQMPRRDGVEVLRAAKARNPETEVIILTGHATLESAIAALREGAHDYLLKPIENLDLFLHTVRRALTHRWLTQENRRLVEELQVVNAGLEQRVAEQTDQLRTAYEQLQTLGHLKARFVLEASLELYALVGGLFKTAHTLQSALRSQDQATAELSEIVTLASRMRGWVGPLLDFSLLERGELELRLQACDVGRVLEEVALVYRPRAERNHVQLAITLPPSKIEVMADPQRLQNAAGQLVDNAIKFTPPGGQIRLSVYGPMAAPWPQAGRSARAVAIAVTDSGVGIPPEKQRDLFQALLQADANPRPQYNVLGIKLDLAARIAALHGGRVTLKSEIGQGSTFALWLPV